MNHRIVPFEELERADINLDATYAGGAQAHAGADPIGKLVPVGNQGGFRFCGGAQLSNCRLAVLYTDGRVPDWPDYVDHQTGRFIYFGDNRRPGYQLHRTPRRGNEFLRQIYEALHANPPARKRIPPILVFEKTGIGRDVAFRGLAVPGSLDSTPIEDLVAVWKTTGRERFQNYRALFTILDCDTVPRTWIDSILAGNALGPGCPAVWSEWVATGRYRPLQALRVMNFRTKAEQLPNTAEGLRIIQSTHKHFAPNPYAFEACAARLWRMAAPSVTSIDVTRPSRDGGRDAIGLYGLGPRPDPVQIDFALEAKCYALDHGVGVRETARLISRLRHRQFGVFVTTSYVSEQAYEELRQDRHPVVVLSAKDIVDILQQHQHGSEEAVLGWLATEFPH